MIQALIFDLDGLIVDTEILESQAIEKILKEYGKTPQFYANGLVHDVGKAGKHFHLDFAKKYQLTADIEEIRRKKREHFESLIRNGKLKPYDGFFELLKEAKNNNFKIALASNRFINHIHLILDELLVTDYFTVVVGPSETRKHKPHPDIYLEAAKQLAIKPEHCLALEDTNTGILSAKAAGMKVIAVPNQYTKDHDFSKADKVVNSLKSVTINLINSL